MSEDNDYIKNNIQEVVKRVGAAAVRSGRHPRDIKIVAVTKTVDVQRILKAIDCGITELGENRVQELSEKHDLIKAACNWHLIGHLQTNKVKYVVDRVQMIHSLDRLELAQELQKRAEKAGKTLEVLVQVNIAEEESKFGMAADSVYGFLREVGKYSNLKVKGLMTIAPFAENPEEIRWVFRELKKLHIDISKENIDNIDMSFLSMGMSNDFEVAIEEGANLIRIGTSIFGKRQY